MLVEDLMREEILFNNLYVTLQSMCQLYTSGSDTYLTADKQLQWKRGEHVQTKAKPSDVDDCIILEHH